MGKLLKDGLLAMGATVGLLGGALGVVYGGFRAIEDAFADKTEYSMECVETEEMFGLMSHVKLKICEDSDMEMNVKRTMNSYTIHVRSSVTKIEMDGRTYTRETGPKELFDAADKKWKEYWEIAEGDKVMMDWAGWKDERRKELQGETKLEEEKQQYGDTIENLVDRL